jgi:hypothetical protein
MTTYSEIQFIEISNNGDLMASVSKYGNKLHIYSLIDFHLKYCLLLSMDEHKIFNLNFNYKNRFVSILSFDGKDLILNLYDLKNSDDEVELCQCDDCDDSDINLISSERAHSLFGKLVSKISHVKYLLIFIKKIFASNQVIPFITGKIKYQNDIKSIKKFLLCFHHIHKDCLVF